MIAYAEAVLDLMDRLPVDRDENLERLAHTHTYGHILELIEDGELKGYGEVFRLKSVPVYPVIPWPKDDPEGKFLYCFSAVCEKGYIRKLIELGKKTFPECDIIYHREKKNHQLVRIYV